MPEAAAGGRLWARCAEPLGWGPAVPQRDASGIPEYVPRGACLPTTVTVPSEVEEPRPTAPAPSPVVPAGVEAAASVLDGLDEGQRAAVLAPLGLLRILAASEPERHGASRTGSPITTTWV